MGDKGITARRKIALPPPPAVIPRPIPTVIERGIGEIEVLLGE